MVTMELEARRQLIREAISELDSAEALGKVQKYIQNLQKKKPEEKPPCQYTVEELKERVTHVVSEIRRGRSGLTSDEFRKVTESWKC